MSNPSIDSAIINSIKKVLLFSEDILQRHIEEKDYQQFTDVLFNLANAQFVAFTLFDEQKNLFVPKAYTKHQEPQETNHDKTEILSLLQERIHPIHPQEMSTGSIVRFASWKDLDKSVFTGSFYEYLNAENQFGEAVIIPLKISNLLSGEFILLFHINELLQNEATVRFYASYIGLLLNLKNTNKLLAQSHLETKAANRAKSQFLANMSHEIRTPLNGLIGFSDLMLLTDLSSTQKSYLDSVIESGRSLMDLMNDILDLSKIEAGQLELNPEPTDLLELCNSSLQLFKHAAFKKRLKLSLAFSSQIPHIIHIDIQKIQQVLNNLISNAIKFTDKGEVELSIEKIDQDEKDKNVQLLFALKDTGIGIAESDQSVIFEVFSQVDSSMKRKFSGTGLGLAICKKLVEKMGGRINVHSQLGHGSTFSFSLRLDYSPVFNEPILKTDEIHKKIIISNQDAFQDNHELLYITDDSRKTEPFKIMSVIADETTRELIFSIFKIHFPDSEVTNFYIFDEAITKFEEHKPGLVLIDLHFPIKDGYDFIKSIRKTEKGIGANIPIICLSSGIINEAMKASIYAGANECFLKPFIPVEFVKRINYWLITTRLITMNMTEKKSQTVNQLYFNPSALLERCGGDKTLAMEMLKLSKPTFTEYIRNLNFYISEKDFKMSKSWAHTIKGAALNMSFDFIAQQVQEINHMQEPDFERMKLLTSEIESAFLQIMAESKTAMGD